MAKYTTEVRSICENYAGLLESAGYGKVDEVIESARKKVFDFAYPIFDEGYRGVLETKILKHFYTKEIGAETVGLWKLWLNTRMNEIMPYYNKLYKSELLEFNPLYDVDITKSQEITKSGTKEDTGETTGTTSDTRQTTGTGTTNGTVNSTETGTSSNNENNYYSDTPQGRVGNVEDFHFLTNARQITNSGNNSTTNNGTSENTNNYTEGVETTGETSGTSKVSSIINNTETYLETVQGKQGGESYSKRLEEYRATFLNIDMRVINELNDLFMNLW